MKISFLLPSKNRLEYLSYAVDSILRQGPYDLEIVISDNASDEDYAGYVAAIGDPRIVYRRQAQPVSVTENWNAALSLATGDYVLMLGDDDALAPDFMRRIAAVIEAHDRPDVVYLAAFHYCYPDVIPGCPAGYLASVQESTFLEGATEAFVLPPETAREVAEAVFDFRYLYGFNSQHFLLRAEFLAKLGHIGAIFQSPYPDTFAAIMSFKKATSIVVIPDPRIMIGISPKSFGYFYFNDLHAEGYAFLDNATLSPDIRHKLEDAILPGGQNNTNWLVAAEAARRALLPEQAEPMNIERYRRLQMIEWLRDIYLKRIRDDAATEQFVARLQADESTVFNLLRSTIASVAAGGEASQPALARMFQGLDDHLRQFHPARITHIDIGAHATIRDAFNWLEAQSTAASPTEPALVPS